MLKFANGGVTIGASGSTVKSIPSLNKKYLIVSLSVIIGSVSGWLSITCPYGFTKFEPLGVSSHNP